MRGPALVLVLAASMVSGCLSNDPIVDPVPPGGPATPTFELPIAVDPNAPGAEPVVAVASDGTIYVEGIGSDGTQNVNKVWRSTDGGANWTDITPPYEGTMRSNDGFVAVGNGDSVYAANVFSLTFQVFRSDDRGATWQKLILPPIPLLMHRHWIVPVGPSTVHVIIEALPPTFAPWLVGGPTPTGTPSHPNEGLTYLVSHDKGATWSLPRQIDPQVNFAGQGNLVVSTDGERLYVPRYEESVHAFEQTYEGGHWYLMASEDGGATWERREMFDLTSELASAVMPLAMDPAGTLYFAWTQEANATSRNFLAVSKDGGRSWSVPVLLAPEAGTQAMPWIAARGDGTLGVLWYAAGVHGTAREVDTSWYVHYALVTAADTATPTALIVNLTAEAVHHGNVCAKGPACESGEDRSLLDYVWLVFAPDGTAHGIFASTEWDRPSAFAVFVRESWRFITG